MQPSFPRCGIIAPQSAISQRNVNACRGAARLERGRIGAYSRAMPETPDLKALAERYLDLWEEQFAAAATDPAMAAAMTAWLGPWRNFTAGAEAATAATRKEQDGRAGAKAKADPQANRAAAAAAAPGDGGRGIGDLLERLERIERRLDALERKRGGKGGGPGAGARRSRTPRAG
ncbi:MAG: hypothetical protein KIT16_21110 [Rhodospirillaceae bacterium]|nr:hypothetical protein [Rhodospirillaceae bacterium]